MVRSRHDIACRYASYVGSVARAVAGRDGALFARHGRIGGSKVGAGRDDLGGGVAIVSLGKVLGIVKAGCIEHGMRDVDATIQDSDLDPRASHIGSAQLSPQRRSPDGEDTSVEHGLKGSLLVDGADAGQRSKGLECPRVGAEQANSQAVEGDLVRVLDGGTGQRALHSSRHQLLGLLQPLQIASGLNRARALGRCRQRQGRIL